MAKIEKSARFRIEACLAQQEASVQAIRQGTPLAAEWDRDRAAERIEAQARLSPEAASHAALVFDPDRLMGPERIWGTTADFVGVAFLERGMKAARTVGRVAFRDGRPMGTGFLIAPGLFLTNNHVVDSVESCAAFAIEFDFETDAAGSPRPVSRFELAPGELFITDGTDDLDYTVVALGRRLDGPHALEAFGYSGLSDATNKHALGDVANIVQHPDGRLKEVVLRENRLVSRLTHVLHYVADTEPGSSGSPVFNNQWQAIALHHWGGPWRQDRMLDGRPVPRFVNEGIRISAIVEELRQRSGELTADARHRLIQALELGESRSGLPYSPVRERTADMAPRVQVRDDGTAVWRVPIEIAVGVPGFSTGVTAATTEAPVRTPALPDPESFRRRVDPSFENRKGYREGFLTGHVVPLPKAASGSTARLARNLDAQPGDHPFEFPYEHFSVCVDGTRGLPLWTACNIDGRNLKSIDRDTGRVSRSESLREAAGPEARERWFEDPRIDPSQCGNDLLYTDQVVSPGRNRTGRIFHRGHMVRRLDPCWGSDAAALRAEADTFHFTNAVPQVGTFNSGRSLWLGLENHVLDNARVDDRRVCVFTGPVLADADPHYRENVFPGFRVPLRFWKIAVWEDGGELLALALRADQSRVLNEIPEAAEDLSDTDDVADFIATVPEIERLTGLDFGSTVRNADLHEDEGPERAGRRRRIRDFSALRLRRSAAPRTRARSRRKSR